MIFKEASYGGAYDIEDDMYFTKEDLLEFTDELIDTLQDKGIFVDLVDMYITDGNRLVIVVEDEDGNEIDTDEFIDMRKIRRPKDIYKYKNIFIKDILSQYDEFKSFNEDLNDEIKSREPQARKDYFGVGNFYHIGRKGDFSKDMEFIKSRGSGVTAELVYGDKSREYACKIAPNKWKTDSGKTLSDNDIASVAYDDGKATINYMIKNKPDNEFKSFNEDLDKIPVIDKLNFINKRRNGMPGIANINEFIDCLNAVGKDKFMVKETKVGSNLSLADLKDEWMTLKKKGWKWYTKNIPGDFLTYYVFEKINKGENMKENLVEDDLQQLKAEVENEVEKYMTSEGFEPDEVKEYSAVDVYFDSKERDRAIVEVRAELSYDGLFELGLRLDKIVANYDEDAYFEPEEPGITTAYIYNITPKKTNKRSKQIKEDYEDEPNYINDLYEILIQAQVCIDKIKENYSSDVYDIIKFGIEQNLDEFMEHDEDDWTMYAAIKESHKSSEEDDDYYNESYDEDDEELTEAKNKHYRKKSYLKEYQKSKFYKPYRYDINKTVKDYLNELIVDIEHMEDAEIRFTNYLITDKGKLEIGFIKLPYDSPIYGDAMIVIPSFDYQWSGDWDSALEIYDSITKKVSEIYDIQTFIGSIDGDLSPEKIDKILRDLSKSEVVDLEESKSIKEDIEDDEDDDYYEEDDEDDENNNYPKNLPEQFYSLYDKLNGDFWTRKDELKQDIEEINDPEYSVEELNDEYVIVTDPEDDMHALQIFNGGTERTYVLDFDRIRYL